MNQPVFDEVSAIVTRLATILSRHVVPLFIEGQGKTHLCGSGFLVSAGASSFLISAAHVFDELRDHNGFFYIEPKTKRSLSGQLRLTKAPDGKNRNQDTLDVGVLKLKSPGFPPYPAVNKCPLSIGSLLPNALPREHKTYLLVGFPESQSRVNPVQKEIESKVYAFRNISHPTKKYAGFGIKPENHIAIVFDIKRSVGSDNYRRQFPDPRGMSGSPVWLLYDEQELHDQKSDDSQKMFVVGIAIEHRKEHRAIVATDIGVALEMINDAA